MATTVGHVRVAARTLLKQPGLALGRMLTISIVITAVGAVLTVANVVFVRPLPFANADRLVRIYMQPPGTNTAASQTPLYPLVFARLRDRVRVFERFEGIWVAPRAISGDGEPESVTSGRASAGLFAALGAGPQAGRLFTEDEVSQAARVVVIGDGFWDRRYGRDAAAIGRALSIDGEPHTIIGVMPPDFDPVFTRTEFWTPLNLRDIEKQAATFIQTVGVLEPSVTAPQAAAEIDGLFAPIQEEMPAVLNNWRNGVIDLREWRFGPQRPAVLLLLAAIAGLSLLAVANLANLTLADVMFRRSDFAVRAALGASKWEMVAPEIVQAAIVAVLGGAIGLAGASQLVPALLALDPANSLAAQPLPMDWRVIGGAIAAAAAIMIVAVTAPLVRLAGPGLASDLTSGSRRAVGGRTTARTRLVLVVAQTAMALVLLSSSALIVKTLIATAAVDPGFDASNVLTAQLRLTARTYATEDARAKFVEQMLDRVRAVPGVVDAGTTLNVFTPGFPFITMVQIEDRPQPDGQPHSMQFRRISPGYLGTMKIGVVSGRDFTPQDRPGSPLVALVSRSLADRFWPDESAVGKRIRRGAATSPWIEVVGVVDDVRDAGLDLAPADTVYTPVYQGSGAAAPVSLVVRTQGDPRALMRDVQRAVWQVDPSQPLASISTLDRFLSDSLGAQRFRATLISVCGLIGLLLATIGTYGVTARSVIERRKEVGVRLALGGSPSTVWWSVASTSIRAICAGAAIGIALSAAARSGLAALLPELEGATLAISVATGAILVVIGALASAIASRSATSVDPLVALRAE